MALIIQKYGGTSVGTFDKIAKVAQYIKACVAGGNRIVAVVSAMNDETDRILDEIRAVSDEPDPREKDLVLATGEIRSAGFLAMALQQAGVPAKSLTGSQIGLITTADFGNAKMVRLSDRRKIRRLSEKQVLVVTGFQGVDGNGEVTTLGRGGSDATAVGLAYALKADICEIYSDVDGVFAVDPRIVPDAKRFTVISPLHLIRMGHSGAGVMMPRSVEIGLDHHIPIRVMLSPSLGKSRGGTLITDEPCKDIERTAHDNMAALVVKKAFGVTVTKIKNTPGQAALIFKALSGFPVVNSAQGISFEKKASLYLLAEKETVLKVKDRLQTLPGLQAEVGLTEELAVITLIDENMVDAPAYFTRIFEALAGKNINILGFSSAHRAIVIIVGIKGHGLAARVLAEEFGLTEH